MTDEAQLQREFARRHLLASLDKMATALREAGNAAHEIRRALTEINEADNLDEKERP